MTDETEVKDDGMKGDNALENDLMGDDNTPDDEPAKEEPAEEKPAEKDEEPAKEEEPAKDDISDEVGGAKDVKDESPIEFPEDSIIGEEVREKLTELVESINIDDETLGEVGDLLETATEDGFNTFKDQFVEEQNARRQVLAKDPLFSEANVEKTWGNVEEVVKRYGSENAKELGAFFNSYHSLDPSLMRMLNNIGESLKSNPEFGGSSVNMPAGEKDSSDLSNLKSEYGAMLGD